MITNSNIIYHIYLVIDIQAFDNETVIPEVYKHYSTLTINYYFTQVYLR